MYYIHSSRKERGDDRFYKIFFIYLYYKYVYLYLAIHLYLYRYRYIMSSSTFTPNDYPKNQSVYPRIIRTPVVAAVIISYIYIFITMCVMFSFFFYVAYEHIYIYFFYVEIFTHDILQLFIFFLYIYYIYASTCIEKKLSKWIFQAAIMKYLFCILYFFFCFGITIYFFLLLLYYFWSPINRKCIFMCFGSWFKLVFIISLAIFYIFMYIIERMYIYY